MNEDRHRLLNRIRYGLVLILGSNLGFALIDWVWLRQVGSRSLTAAETFRFWSFGLKAFQVVAIGVAFATLRCFPGRYRQIAITTIALVCSSTSVSGVATGDTTTTPILMIALTFGAAMLVPWERREQLLVAAIGLSAVLFHGFALRHEFDSPYPVIASCLALVISVVIGREFRRSRREQAIDQLRRAEVEAELRKSEARFRGAFDNAPVGIGLANLDGRWLQVNRALCQILGYSEADLLACDVRAVIHPDDRGVSAESEARMRACELGALQRETRYLRRDGRVVRGLLALSLVRDEHGAPLYFINQIDDITERRRAEEERDRYFHLSIDMLCVADFHGRFRQVNPAFERCLGYTTAELLARPIFELIHPDDFRSTASVFEALWDGREISSFVNRYRHHDGSYRWIEWTARSSDDRRIFAVGRDVTERAHVLQGTVDALSADIAVLDERGRITAVNAAWRRFCDDHDAAGDENYAVGRSYVEVCGAVRGLSERDAMRASAGLKLLTANSAPGFSLEYVAEGRSAGCTYELRASRFEVDGKVRLVLAHEDISDRKRAEREIIAARDAALRASGIKSRFLATMSHEIRTPLAAVAALIDLLRDTAVSDEQRQYLETIARSNSALLGLMTDVLDLAKLEAGRVDLEVHDVDVRQIVREIEDLFAPEARRKGVALRSVVAPSVPLLLVGDRIRVRQIFVNLVANAVKFTDAGSVTVEVAVAEASRVALRLRGMVHDTGTGIEPGDQPRVFDAFTQGRPVGPARRGGTGLGLAICKELVELMNGSVQLESRVGVGTTVSFTIELGLAQDDGTVVAEGGVDLEPVGEVAPAGTRVLLVDDNEINRWVGMRLLERVGFEPEVACDGPTALRMLASADYGAVLMDCAMPGMDGYEVTRRIRESESGTVHRMPVIALTADATAEARSRCLDAGMNDYLAKPVTPEMLRRTLVRWLRYTVPSRPAAEVAAEVDDSQLDRVLEALGGDEDLLREMAEVYLEHSPPLLAAIRAAVEADDLAALERTAHALKGSVSNFGRLPSWQAANELELLGKRRAHEGVRAALAILETTFAQFEGELRQMIQDGAERREEREPPAAEARLPLDCPP